MNLVIDVGNTESVLGLFHPDTSKVLCRWRYSTRISRTSDELGLLIRTFLGEEEVVVSDLHRVVVGSVVPHHTEAIQGALEPMGAPILLLEDADALPIRLDVEEPRTVGADRLANTLAVASLFGEDSVVVDLGTATTYDCISAEGVFLGGVIAPGLESGEEWLGGRTAKLPRVGIRRPSKVIGRRTEACLQSGLFYSAVDAIDGIVSRIREEWGRPEVRVIGTGGYAASIASHSKTIQSVDPDLTLVGLELAGRFLAVAGAATETSPETECS